MSTFNDLLSKYTKVIEPTVPSLIVCDGTDINEYIPLYGYWCDADQQSQMIYPASLLQPINITQVVFYHNKTTDVSNNFGTDNVLSFKISDTDFVTDSFQTDLTQVAYSNRLVNITGGGLLIFDLDTPYKYRGGNLLIDITHPKHSYASISFYGQVQPTVNNQSFMKYKGTTARGPFTFLPKMGLNQGL